MKRIWLAILLSCLLAQPVQAQDGTKLYLPLITKSGRCEPMTDPILRISDGTKVIDLLGPGSGWELADPYWQPQIAQFKGGGAFVDSGLAEGKQLVHREYDNVIETIPLSVTGTDQGAAIQTIRDLLQLGRQASDYYTESYEYDDVWLEAKPACANSLTGYSRIIKMSIPNLSNIFGQPFFSAFEHAVMEDLTLTIEREPFWRGTPPGEIIGPLYNLIKNPDFELWNFGTVDSQPDNWNDIETLWITGENNANYNPKFGKTNIKIVVRGSTKAGAAKGISQVLTGIDDNTEYTVLAWVRSEGISNGVSRILITYNNQYELYRSSSAHGWTLYVGTITTGTNDTVGITCEILTTSANTVGTFYVDAMMFVKGNWIDEVESGTLPYLSSSVIVNHWDQPSNTIVTPGNIDWLDVWNVPGDVDSLVKIETINFTVPADYSNVIETINKLRIGLRRTGNVFNFDNYNEAVGALDATASSNDSITTGALTPNYSLITTKTVVNNVIDNLGRFRLFSRIYDNKASGNSNLQQKANYFLGISNVNNKNLTDVTGQIRQNWTITDLTPNKSINFVSSDKKTLPSTVGYNINIKRPTGTDTMKFDYSILMPTDGGYTEIEVNPGAIYKNTIMADYTLSSPDISLKLLNAGSLTIDLNDPVYNLNYVVNFKGDIYVSGNMAIAGAQHGRIWRKRQGTWSIVYNDNLGVGAISSLIVYNNNLYATTSKSIVDAGAAYLLMSSDGSAWTSILYSVNRGILNRPIIYNNKIWFTFSDLITGRSYLSNYDGFVFSTPRTSAVAETFTGLANFAGKLYIIRHPVGTYIIEYSTDGILWTTVYTTAIGLGRMQPVANDYLLISGFYNILRSDDGVVFKIIPVTTNVQDTIIYNGVSYYIDVLGKLWQSTDGENYTISSTVLGNPTFTACYINLVDGLLHIVADNNYAIFSSNDVSLKIADYKGSRFSLPNRTKENEKRSRFFFLYDRANYVNNKNDKALIGIGIVPRYLSLINYYPQ